MDQIQRAGKDKAAVSNQMDFLKNYLISTDYLYLPLPNARRTYLFLVHRAALRK